MASLTPTLEQRPSTGSRTQERVPEFTATIVHEAVRPVYGLAVGEFDPAHDGVEFAYLLADASVHQLSREASGWSATLLAEGTTDILGMFDRPTIEIGDVHSGYDGNEIVAECGRKMTLIYRDAAGDWSSEVLFDASGMTGGGWGARVGDVDTTHPGEEIFLIFEAVLDASNGTLFAEVDGTWEEEEIYSGEVGMDSAIGDSNPTHVGPEVVLVTEMGPTYEILPPESPHSGDWPKNMIWNDYENAAWVVEIADVDPALPGNECVYGTRYNNRITLSHRTGSGGHDLEVLFNGSAQGAPPLNMWDIAVGDVLTDSAMPEILGVDQTGSVYLVWRDAGVWEGQTIWGNTADPLHAVLAGDFLAEQPGDEILVAGQSGTITLLVRDSALPGDFDGDGDVDLEDYAEFPACMSGPDLDPGPEGCDAFDFEFDLDVDLLDFASFQAAFTGHG
jgi:hypothetical protein